MAHRFLVRALLLVVSGLVAAGCAGGDVGGPQEAYETQQTDQTPLVDPAENTAACVPESGAPAGYGSTGSTQPGQVGTGTGDIGAETACPTPAAADG